MPLSLCYVHLKVGPNVFLYGILSAFCAALLSFNLSAQTFLNGSFENNTAVADLINLSNIDFNAAMSNTTAFGTTGNMDIITSTTWGGGSAQNGNWYVALTGFGTDMFAMELSTPLVIGASYTISFWDRSDVGFTPTAILVGVSNSSTAFGTTVYTAPVAPTVNVWTQRTFTFVATTASQYITVQQSAGSTGNWAHVDNFVFENCILTPDLGPDTTLCNGQSFLLDATHGAGATYLWHDNSTNPTFNVTTAGTYYVEVDSAGCIGSDTIVVSYQPPPQIDLGNDTTLCIGQSITLDATTLGATYLWNTTEVTPTISVTSSGTYDVQVQIGSCLDQDTITINFTPNPVVDLGADTALCDGTQLTLDASGSPSATYLWYDNTINPTNQVSTTGTYWVDVTLNGCVSTDSINVVYNPIPLVDLGPDLTLCDGDVTILDPGNAGATFLWQDNTAGATYNVSLPGTYWVDVDISGCIGSDTVEVFYNPLPIVDLGADTALCDGTPLTLDASGSPSATYLWYDNTVNPTNQVSTTGTYWVDVTLNGCVSIDSINVVYNPIPVVDLGPDLTLCDGDVAILDPGNAGATFLWQDNTAGATYNVSLPGTYWVDVDISGCIGSDTVEVFYNPLPIVDLGNDTSVCAGEVVTLDATFAGATYLWQDNSINAVYNAVLPGTYSVTVTAGGCSFTDDITIQHIQIPQFSLGADVVLCEDINETLLLTTSETGTYLWQDNSTGNSFFVNQSGTYWLEVTNVCGSASDTIRVTSENCNCSVYVPNAFSPNGDGINDEFVPIYDCTFKDYQLRIYDRWGQLIYSTTDPQDTWNGRYNGDLAPIDVYVYVVDYREDVINERIFGHVTLVR